MSKSKILIQLDPDKNPSTFDSVVAIDSGVDHLLTQASVTAENATGLVHGAMFTRGPADLKSTAIFVGGSDVEASEAIVQATIDCFFGPMRVSLMSDPNGSNTTAAAAVLCAEQHSPIDGQTTTILAGTGPVGQRIAQIVANQATKPETSIRVCSRRLEKAKQVCENLQAKTGFKGFVPIQSGTPSESLDAIEGSNLVFAAGAAGIELLPEQWLSMNDAPAVAIDLNAVPPAGISGIEVMDKATQRNNTLCYGAIGVGGLKMKIHKRCLASLFESNDKVLGTMPIYEVGKTL
jgi:hypothetical protein